MAEITTEINAVDNKEVNKDVINDYEKKLSVAKQELKELKEFQQLALDTEKANKTKKDIELTANNEFKSLYESQKSELEKVKAEYEKTMPKFKELSEFKKTYDEQQNNLRLAKIDELTIKYQYDDVKKAKLIAMNQEQFDIFMMLLPDIKTSANSIDTTTKNTMTNIDTSKMTAEEAFEHEFKMLFPDLKSN